MYGSLSALTLHIRQKHVEVATVMMGLDPEHQLLPIHARSIAAYINNAMTRRHVMPVMTASEALSRHSMLIVELISVKCPERKLICCADLYRGDFETAAPVEKLATET